VLQIYKDFFKESINEVTLHKKRGSFGTPLARNN
jgi:hypothetical protein